MDSRQKIVSPPEAMARLALWGDYTLVSGTFDPLLASHARRLESVRSPGTPLAVIVTEPALPILPGRARAELVAALGAVELVILPEGPPDQLPQPSFRFEDQDARETEAFVAHVRERQA
jgi:hypothetical protein